MAECERCDGRGFEFSTRKGKDGEEVECVRLCSCRHPGPGQPEDLVRALRIPPRYDHCVLENFEICQEFRRLQTGVLGKVLRYCDAFPSPDVEQSGLGLLLTGGTGVGKTHLAVATLRELASKHGVRGQFWDYHELLQKIRESYDSRTNFAEYEVLEPLVTMDVLLLDDLGAWRITDWMNDTLFYILNQRFMARRATLITTNYPDRSPSPAHDGDAGALRRESLEDRIGARLRSRLHEACVILRLDGPDRRQLAVQGLNQTLVS